VGDVGEGGGDFGGGVVVGVVDGLLAARRGGGGEGVGDGAVGEDGEVHDGGGDEQVLLEGLLRASQQAWDSYSPLKKEKDSAISAARRFYY